MNAKQKNFLLLRADDISLDKIAKEINVSKPTLIKWSKQFHNEINDLQFESLIAIKDEYSFSKKTQYKQLLAHLNKIDDGITNADLSKTSIKDLMYIRNNITTQLESLECETQFINTEVMEDFMLGEKEVSLKLEEI